MAYPTVSFKPISAELGTQPISETSTTQKHPLGHRIRALDATYGEAEFIYLKGVASTAAGDLVQYDKKAATTTRAVHGSKGGPVAVAMSANVANQYGWYAVHGSVPVASGGVLADKPPYMTATPGQVDDAIVAGDEVLGAHFKEADAGGFATVEIAYPSTPLALTMV